MSGQIRTENLMDAMREYIETERKLEECSEKFPNVGDSHLCEKEDEDFRMAQARVEEALNRCIDGRIEEHLESIGRRLSDYSKLP